MYQQLLVELYSQCPKVISWLSDLQGSIFDGQLSQSTITQVKLSTVDTCICYYCFLVFNENYSTFDVILLVIVCCLICMKCYFEN